MAPENKAAYEAKLAECRNNPGVLKDDPNCINAATARHKLFARGGTNIELDSSDRSKADKK